jgi:hypothetical protein
MYYVQKCMGGFTVEKPALNVGQYHPRVWRRHPDIERHGEPVLRVENTPDVGPFIHSLEQVECLFEDLVAIFRVVHPTPELERLRGRNSQPSYLGMHGSRGTMEGSIRSERSQPKK